MFDSRYSQQGVQWAVKQASKRQNPERSECSYASSQFCDASSGRWDGYFEHQKSSWVTKILIRRWFIFKLPTFNTKKLKLHRSIPFFRIWEEMRGFKTKKNSQLNLNLNLNTEVADVLNKLGSKLEDLGLNSWQLRTLFALKSAEHRLWEDISMLATNAEISASATTPAETVIARKCQGRNREDWIQTRKPNCFLTYFKIFIFVLIRFRIRWFYASRSIEQKQLHEPKMLYDILFESVWETLQTFGKTKISNGNDCCFCTLGDKFKSSSAFSLHCSRWWRG